MKEAGKRAYLSGMRRDGPEAITHGRCAGAASWMGEELWSQQRAGMGDGIRSDRHPA